MNLTTTLTYDVVDYHADMMTCLSQSSGTVSYESIPVANGRVDRQIHRVAINCIKQPPRPQFVAKKVKLLNKSDVVKIIPIDINALHALQKVRSKRNKQLKTESLTVNHISDITPQFDKWLDEAFNNMNKRDEPKKKLTTEIRIDMPRIKDGKVTISKKTMNQITLNAYRELVGEEATIHQCFHAAANYVDVPEAPASEDHSLPAIPLPTPKIVLPSREKA
ncbi:unnamed protein product [Caenorhabditis bovis]|uniref:Uncharacterized protein n=1 Tax=Caenorhabditis bovis TaxID=2654633 RepID=A0A8S1F1V5_9PELO|nr:unnamed protein product [Caenorhabditis bovis]